MYLYTVSSNTWSTLNLPNFTGNPNVLQFSDGTVVYGGGNVSLLVRSLASSLARWFVVLGMSERTVQRRLVRIRSIDSGFHPNRFSTSVPNVECCKPSDQQYWLCVWRILRWNLFPRSNILQAHTQSLHMDLRQFLWPEIALRDIVVCVQQHVLHDQWLVRQFSDFPRLFCRVLGVQHYKRNVGTS